MEIEVSGVKYDAEKAKWHLLPYDSLRQVVEVLTFGAKKYREDNWKAVPDPKPRYFSAAMRHLTAWFEGEKYDPESGYSHLAHAACCILFLIYFDSKN